MYNYPFSQFSIRYLTLTIQPFFRKFHQLIQHYTFRNQQRIIPSYQHPQSQLPIHNNPKFTNQQKSRTENKNYKFKKTKQNPNQSDNKTKRDSKKPTKTNPNSPSPLI